MATTVASEISIRYDTRVLHRFSSQDATPHNTSMPFSFGGPIQDESKLVAQHVRHQKQTKTKNCSRKSEGTCSDRVPNQRRAGLAGVCDENVKSNCS
jgi:hypothetical protein